MDYLPEIDVLDIVALGSTMKSFSDGNSKDPVKKALGDNKIKCVKSFVMNTTKKSMKMMSFSLSIMIILLFIRFVLNITIPKIIVITTFGLIFATCAYNYILSEFVWPFKVLNINTSKSTEAMQKYCPHADLESQKIAEDRSVQSL